MKAWGRRRARSRSSLFAAGEPMVWLTGGALAVIFNSRYGWGTPPVLGPSEKLDMRFYDFFFKAFQGIGQCRFRQTEVVTDLKYLSDNFVTVFLTYSNTVHDFAGGHGNLGGINAIGTINGTAAAL